MGETERLKQICRRISRQRGNPVSKRRLVGSCEVMDGGDTQFLGVKIGCTQAPRCG